MTPKKLLNKLQAEATNEIGKARYEGALVIYEYFLNKQRKYYDENREHNREYQREYHRRWRAARKVSEKQIEKEVADIK